MALIKPRELSWKVPGGTSGDADIYETMVGQREIHIHYPGSASKFTLNFAHLSFLFICL